MVDAIVLLGHSASACVRVSTVASNIDKTKLIDFFKSRGINIVYGDIYEKAKLVATINKVDVVVCTLSNLTPRLYEDEVMFIEQLKKLKKSWLGVTADDPPALKVGYNLAVARFVKGQTMIDIDLAFGMETSGFYSEADFASVDEPLDCCQ